LAVLAHEIPQEIGDFGVLIHSGFSRKKALWLNFLTALTAVLGVLVAVMVSNITIAIETVLLPFAVGSFLYIAGSDLIPELHKETGSKQALGQILGFLAGVGVMALLLVVF